MKLSKFKTKLGEMCITYFFVIGTAAFVLPYINGIEISNNALYICVCIMFVLFLFAFLLLAEKEQKPLPGKWKRIKVKQDTTVHVEEIQ